MKDFLFKRKSILTANQILRLANIAEGAGQGAFVVVVLSPLIIGLDRINFSTLGLGIVATTVSWLGSLWLTGKGEKI